MGLANSMALIQDHTVFVRPNAIATIFYQAIYRDYYFMAATNQMLCLYYSARICKFFCKNKLEVLSSLLHHDRCIITTFSKPLFLWAITLLQSIAYMELQSQCLASFSSDFASHLPFVPQTFGGQFITTNLFSALVVHYSSKLSAVLTWGSVCRRVVKL